MCRLERDDTTPAVGVGDVQLNTLASFVAKSSQRRASDLGQRKLILGGATEADQFESETEPTLWIASDETVQFEGNGEPMGGCPGQGGRLLQVGQVEWTTSQGAQDENPFVNDADTAYTVHNENHISESEMPCLA
jgi:hypothetical protein